MRDATGISRRSVGFRRAVAVQISTGAAPVLRVINRSETQSVNEQPKSLGAVFRPISPSIATTRESGKAIANRMLWLTKHIPFS